MSLGQKTALPFYLWKSSTFPNADPIEESGSAAGGKATNAKPTQTVKLSFTANRQAEPAKTEDDCLCEVEAYFGVLLIAGEFLADGVGGVAERGGA